MKRMPEKKKVPEVDLELQAERLCEIAQNQHFQNLRGQCEGKLIDNLYARKSVKTGEFIAPSRYVDTLKSFCESLPIIFGKIAQLERDGFQTATEEIFLALRQPHYRMLGEKNVSEKIKSYTLIVFEAAATMSYMSAPVCTGEKAIRPNTMVDLSLAADELKKMFRCDKFYRRHDNSGLLPKVYMSEFSELLWKKTEPLLTKLQLFGRKKYSSFRKFYHADNELLELNPKNAMWEKGLAYVFETKQQDMLRAFSRAEQDRIATWQFNLALPQSDKYGRDYFCVGLYPENEHAYWQKLRGAFCSQGVNFGYGAVIYPGEAFRCFDAKFKKNQNKRILLY